MFNGYFWHRQQACYRRISGFKYISIPWSSYTIRGSTSEICYFFTVRNNCIGYSTTFNITKVEKKLIMAVAMVPTSLRTKKKSQNLFLKNFYHKCQISWICSKIYHRMIWLENWNYTLRITFTVLIRLSSNFAGW